MRKAEWLLGAALGAACTAVSFLVPISQAIPSHDVIPWRILESLLALGLLAGISAMKRSGTDRV
jgi:hypothetical protein